MNIERLEKACQFIEQLPEENFNFGTVREEESCGTVGCFCGWLPEIFPEKFSQNEYGRIYFDPLGNCLETYYYQIAAYLFDIPDGHADELFTPNRIPYKVWPEESGIVTLNKHATNKEVVENVRRYIKYYGSTKDSGVDHG